MSADLDALDRGVIEAGQIAAEAVSRVEALEVKVGALLQMLEFLSGGQIPATRTPARRACHLTLVRPS